MYRSSLLFLELTALIVGSSGSSGYGGSTFRVELRLAIQSLLILSVWDKTLYTRKNPFENGGSFRNSIFGKLVHTLI